MPRRAAKVDENQAEIVAALRGVGASVQPLHAVGQGVPDLLVGYAKLNLLIEVVGSDKLNKYRATGGKMPSQVEWHDAWRGQVCTVRSVDEALNALGIVRVKGSIS